MWKTRVRWLRCESSCNYLSFLEISLCFLSPDLIWSWHWVLLFLEIILCLYDLILTGWDWSLGLRPRSTIPTIWWMCHWVEEQQTNKQCVSSSEQQTNHEQLLKWSDQSKFQRLDGQADEQFFNREELNRKSGSQSRSSFEHNRANAQQSSSSSKSSTSNWREAKSWFLWGRGACWCATTTTRTTSSATTASPWSASQGS